VTAVPDSPLDELIERLAQRRADLVSTIELMQGQQDNVNTAAHELENPQAVRDYLTFFTTLFSDAATQCANIAAELTTEGIKADHIIALKKLSGVGTREQQRCLQFRDKWINKPLPHEAVRPLLNDISITTRDQLTALKDVVTIASRLGTLYHGAAAPAKKEEERTFDRRSLFTRFLKR
jgi:DNA invertase Pin-like site-specific DNA recombinase